jgi:hypothetical protein
MPITVDATDTEKLLRNIFISVAEAMGPVSRASASGFIALCRKDTLIDLHGYAGTWLAGTTWPSDLPGTMFQAGCLEMMHRHPTADIAVSFCTFAVDPSDELDEFKQHVRLLPGDERVLFVMSMILDKTRPGFRSMIERITPPKVNISMPISQVHDVRILPNPAGLLRLSEAGFEIEPWNLG